MKLATVRRFALSLSGVTERPHHAFSSFRCNGRIFVTVPPEEDHIHVFVSEWDRESALAKNPAGVEKLWWGGRVVGVRVNLAAAAAPTVKSLVLAAYKHKARAEPALPRKRS